MRIRSTTLLILLSLVAFNSSFAQNLTLGTWRLNEAKSKIPAGIGKSTTVVYSAVGSEIKVTADGIDGSGQPAHSEWIGKFDAKPYPVTGDPDVTYRAYKTKGERLLLLANMKGDKTVSNGRIHLAKDGKNRTLAMTFFGSHKTRATYVYDRQ